METVSDSTRHTQKVDQLFGAIAARYDLVNDIQSLGLHRIWKRRVVVLANFNEGETGLDLCCGTGDIAIGLAKRGGAVVGMDLNRPMLLQAAARLAKRGDQCVRLAQADALNLPLGNHSLDLVTIGYGLRNLGSMEDGLREITRVLKPGGRLLILDFGKPANRLLPIGLLPIPRMDSACFWLAMLWQCIRLRLYTGLAEKISCTKRSGGQAGFAGL